jgi:hypothetical protein
VILPLLLALAAVSTEAPPYHVVHPASLSREAEQIAGSIPVVVEKLSRALNAPVLPPSTLYLVSRDSTELAGEAGDAMPEWAAGVAMPWSHTVIIRADRVGSWRQRELTGVLAHETAHMLMAAAAGAGADLMPPWFREGVASNLARDGEWLDFFYLWVSPIPSSGRPLDDLSAGFSAGASPVMTRAAYAGSYSFVRHALDVHSATLPGRVLEGLRAGLDFEAAWRAAAGMPLSEDESAWSASIRGRTRWAAILTSSATLWLIITLLVLLAWLIKKRRGSRVMEGWTEEDPFE